MSWGINMIISWKPSDADLRSFWETLAGEIASVLCTLCPNTQVLIGNASYQLYNDHYYYTYHDNMRSRRVYLRTSFIHQYPRSFCVLLTRPVKRLSCDPVYVTPPLSHRMSNLVAKEMTSWVQRRMEHGKLKRLSRARVMHAS
jgi:hypothetical protein